MARKKSADGKSSTTESRRGRRAADAASGQGPSEEKAASKKATRPRQSPRRVKRKSSTKKQHTQEKRKLHTGNGSFPVVGIGASAGGLEAFRELLEHLPTDTGMAFVLVSHLDPTHKSILTELLARRTELPVTEVSDGMKVEPNNVYVLPPNTSMAIAEGILRLQPREEGRAGRHPIDYFLRTLADDQTHRAIGVILSGTDSDGTLGLEAIKSEGGITFAQDAKSAKYDGMPRSAAASGHVDFVLTPQNIAKELARISRHPFVNPIGTAAEESSAGRNGFRKILALLQKSKGVDFSDYKGNTLHRRITRRMVLNKFESTETYAKFMRENAAEVEALYQDILINVTSFFRNPDAFAVLKETIFPHIVAHHTSNDPIRIWTLGCSTGEEAYSIAISFAEFAADQAEHLPVQVFATDLSDRGIEKARTGFYPRDVTQDVSPERLRRFFTEADGGYRISKPIRDMVVFARQNVIADPPFSRLDLISCRNLLIYLEPVLQKHVLPILHYALKPTGVLWLGTSETPGSSSDLFTPEDRKHRFYRKKPASARLQFHSAPASATRKGSGHNTNYLNEQLRAEHDAQKEADRILLTRFSPAGVVINSEMEILQFRGSTGAYLEPPVGKATLNLLKMAREGLMLPLRAAIQKAKKDDLTVRKEDVRVNYNGDSREIALEVIPIKGLTANERCFLVLFEPVAAIGTQKSFASKQNVADRNRRRTNKESAEDDQSARLREELSVTREYMQSLVEQHEAANEELQSANEEIQSSNEELQSINEELETAKEELESGNEELTTLNDELHNRNQELATLNDDLANLFASVNIPILMLGRDLRIRRFTPQAEKVLSLIATDVGRPVSDFQRNINVPDLEELIVEVIDTVSVKAREVQDRNGHWYLMHVRPYMSLDNKIDGAVVVLVDIDDLKNYSEAIVETMREPLIVLDERLQVRTANQAFYEKFQVTPEETENKFIYDLGNRQWNIPALRKLLEDLLPRNDKFQDFEVEHAFDHIGQRTMLLNARRLEQKDRRAQLILLAIEDITDSRQTQELRESEARYEALVKAATQIVWTTDASGAVVEDSSSWRAFTGQTYEQWKGFGWLDILHPDDRDRVAEQWRRTVAEGSGREIEYRIRHISGEWRWTVARVVPVLNSDGSVREWIGSNTDITELKRADEERENLLAREHEARRQAETANRVKDEFLATISHELRTPLNAIMGWTEMLVRGKLDADVADKGLKTIARNARAQNQLISDLLDVSRIISGQLRFESSAVELAPIIEAAADTVRLAAEAKGVALNLNLEPAAGVVSGDASRLQQIVWNLLTNAVKYTPKKGRVEVHLKPEDTSVVIMITDTGEGITPEFLPYIFDRFRQADSATTREYSGLGLGLAIVRHLVEAHGGSVRATSDGAGKGATFTVILPSIALRPTGEVKKHTSGELSKDQISSLALKGVSMLVVDDESDVRDLITIALTQSGAEVRSADNVRAALKILDQWKPDVLLSDIGMPGADGYELMRKVRARAPERGGRIPALAVTGYAATEDAERALKAGYEMHMAKPVVLSELVTRVASLAESTARANDRRRKA
jgi:two-component system, chemotaxis family, CheB/CheR fusion protein